MPSSAPISDIPVEERHDVFETKRTFRDLGLNDELLRAIEKKGFIHPTHVQAELIPMALSGRDILGQSKTGTGKTASFALPILHQLDGETPFAALVLTPTRELAIQVTREMRELADFSRLQIVAVYGGQRIRVQAEKLKKGPAIIVGTPGRVMDMHRRNLLPYDNLQIAVLDEVDRMLDIGFRDDIRRILGTIQHPHQTIFVSATISEEIGKLARQYMKDPVRLELTTSSSLTVQQVTQQYFSVQPWDKQRLLLHLFTHEELALTLVFCRTKQRVDGLAEFLNRKGIDAHAIHGDMYQSKRNSVMQKLREGELSVLVASDLAARGLDVDDITHVINYDLPEDPDIYVHRIGRTARAGREGIAWSFVQPDQGELLTNIEQLTNVEISKAVYDDFEPGQPPADVAASMQLAEERQASRQKGRSREITTMTKEAKKDDERFPGGIVPSAPPPKKLGGRLRSGRRR